METRSKSSWALSVSLLAMSSIALVPTGAVAQAVAADDDDGTALDVMVVSARKRAQSLQDVPLAVQAFDGDDIREKGLRDFQDYAKELTSVSFGTSSPGATTIAFRGALAQPTGFDTISSSILYLDEIPITRDGQNPDVRLIDIERIEALSGPQPTIYGAGSQSGTLKIVTAKPDTSGFSGWVNVGAATTKGGEESYDISGAVNIPLIENKLAIRLVGFYEYEGGYIDNVLGTTSAYSPNNGTRDNADQVEDDINDYSGEGGRATVRYQPNDDWTIDVGVIYQNSSLDNLFDFNPDFGDLNTIKFKDERRDDEWYNTSITVQGDLGFADLTIAGGWHNRTIDYDIDSTAYMTNYRDNGLAIAEYYTGLAEFPDYATCTYYYICFVNYNDFGPNPTGVIELDQRVNSFVQEVRLTSSEDSDSRFSWLVGAFYENTNNDWDYISRVDDFAENGGPNGEIFAYYGVAPTDVWFDQGFREGFTYNGRPGNEYWGYRGDLESVAFFGEVGIDITDTINISGGGRWFTTDFRVRENDTFVGTNPGGNDDGSETTQDFAGRANITWEPTDDFLAYFTYSEGVRIGGANGGAQTQAAQAIRPNEFSSDKLKNYEIGLKSQWFDGRAIANITAFMMNWNDFQIQAIFPAPAAGAAIVNAGNASIDGVEGQFAFKPTSDLELSLAATYIDATLDDDIVIGGGALIVGGEGDELPATPNWKLSAGILYTKELPWSGLEGFSRFDYAYTGESVNGTAASLALFGSGSAIPATQPDYQIGDLSFGVRSDDWEISLAINNVWDERAITYIWPRFADDRVFTVRPREIRLSLYKAF
ncbi:MAG: TonB-dependent receptor [Pseudomonadota bacterium]